MGVDPAAQTNCWLLETEQESASVLTALLGYIDVLITWLMNANYITAFLMPEMPIAASSEFSPVHFYSPGFHAETSERKMF